MVARLSQACDKVAGSLLPCHNIVITVWVESLLFLHKLKSVADLEGSTFLSHGPAIDKQCCSKDDLLPAL